MTTQHLPEGTWSIVAYVRDGEWERPVDGSDPHLVVSADGISGTSGLNRLMTSQTTIPLGPVATTMMAGPPELMLQEQTLLELLSAADQGIHGLSSMFLLGEGVACIELELDGTAG